MRTMRLDPSDLLRTEETDSHSDKSRCIFFLQQQKPQRRFFKQMVQNITKQSLHQGR